MTYEQPVEEANGYGGDEKLLGTKLYPPQARQAHTPPPQKEDLDTPDHGEANGHIPKSSGASIDDIAFCAIPADYTKRPATGKRKRGSPEREDASDATQSLAEWLRKGVVGHQLGLTVNLCLFVGLSWLLFTSIRPRMSAFFELSYPQTAAASRTLYGQGPRDLLLVISLIVIFTGFRAFMLDYVLSPCARHLGIRRSKAQIRFAEQSYLLLYYIIYWTLGVWLFVQDTPASLPGPLGVENLLISLWTGFPRLYLDAGMKIYYLSQMAFWVQQILVIHLEEKRKDHYQMLTHHFVTVALMSTSYGYRQWRVGNAVLVCMDIVDLIFPTAKILRYLGWQKACDAAFALFVVVWLAARHAAYLTICWSIYAHVNEVVMPYGTYSLQGTTGSDHISGLRLSADGGKGTWQEIFQPFVEPNAATVGFNPNIRWSFLGLLLGLQCITLMWFVMICRVVAKVLRGEGADDSRSDDEGDEEADPVNEVDEKLNAPQQRFIEVETTAEDLSYASHSPRRSGSGSKRKSKGSGFSSGLNLGERKEILNRIGCLSEEQLAREREKRESSPRPGSGGSTASAKK